VSAPFRADAFAFNRRDVVAVLAVTLRPLQAGEWVLIGNHPVVNADLNRVLDGLRESGYVGLSSPNTNTVEALMNAYHGLTPWEIGSHTDFLRRLTYRRSEE
jgi:hypothetical protein